MDRMLLLEFRISFLRIICFINLEYRYINSGKVCVSAFRIRIESLIFTTLQIWWIGFQCSRIRISWSSFSPLLFFILMQCFGQFWPNNKLVSHFGIGGLFGNIWSVLCDWNWNILPSHLNYEYLKNKLGYIFISRNRECWQIEAFNKVSFCVIIAFMIERYRDLSVITVGNFKRNKIMYVNKRIVIFTCSKENFVHIFLCVTSISTSSCVWPPGTAGKY